MQREGERVRKECEMRRWMGRGVAADGFVSVGCKWFSFVWVGGENGFVWYFIFMALMPAVLRRAAPVTFRLKE
jgi:hypothetical protein